MVARRPRVDLFELAAFAAFAAVSIWVLGLDLWQVLVRGRQWTGTDGLFLTDQMQYLAWIQDASRHVLASNLFVVHRTPADYFQPLVVISGGIAALGLAPSLVLLLWKPVAVLSAFLVVRAYVRRSVTGRWERRAALTLALFFGSWGVVGDLWLPLWSWGYPFGLVAVAAIGGALLLYDRARRENRLAWGPPLLGALASSLHPWQGETLILIVIGAEVVSRWRSPGRERWQFAGPGRWRSPARGIGGRRSPGAAAGPLEVDRPFHRRPGGLALPDLPALHHHSGDLALTDPPRESALALSVGSAQSHRLALPAITVIATAIPLGYLAVLGRADLSWRLARNASHHSFPLASIVLALAPLLLVCVLAYRGRAQSFLAAATRVWPLAALGVYLISATSVSATPLHAFAGITIPLAVLGVQGVQRAGWRRVPGHRAVTALVLAAATIPAAGYEMSVAPDYMAPERENANFISPDMSRALAYLKGNRERGGVLTRAYLGVIVPGETGRNTYVGGCQWSTPHCARRVIGSWSLFGATMRPQVARAFVLGTTARFVLSGCRWSGNLATVLAPITRSVHRFGCARVYEIAEPAKGPRQNY